MRTPEVVALSVKGIRRPIFRFEDLALPGQASQIIVLEHAYFADDERFVKAADGRSLETEKLIPEHWPQRLQLYSAELLQGPRESCRR